MFSHGRSLTTNHLLKKGDLWLTQILAVCPNRTSTIFSTVLTHHSPAFITIWKHLEQVGIFDPLMMQTLNRQSETLRAGANYHLLGAMRRVEERDRERFSQPPNEERPTP